MPSMFRQNLRFCLSNLFRLSRYFENGLLRTLATHLGVVWFVVSVWRRHELAIVLGGLAVGGAAFAYDRIALAPSEGEHLVALALTWGGLGTSVAVTLTRVLNFHRSRIYGDRQARRHTLSRRFFMERPPDGSTPPYPTLGDIVSEDPQALPILTVGSPARPVNRAQVDLTVARALMNDQTIAIETTPAGAPFHGDRRDIMALNTETIEGLQTDALQIMRREAIHNRVSFFDSPKISLASLEVTGKGLRCTLRRTSYFVTCLTNDLSTQSIAYPDGSEQTSDTITSLYPAVVDPGLTAAPGDPVPLRPYRLRPLRDCAHLSNHVGSMVLAISSDGIPVLCFQGAGARINPGKVVVSGAGSIDLTDLAHAGGDGRDLGRVIRYGMARELLEETGAIPQESSRPHDRALIRTQAGQVRLAGMYRDLRRGGLPIFVGFSRMRATSKRIRSRSHNGPCWLQSPAETRVVVYLEELVIRNAADMLDYLEHHIRGTARFRCDASDQLMLVREMLRLPEMRAHFDIAIGAAPAPAPRPDPAVQPAPAA